MYMTNHYCYYTKLLSINTNFVVCGEFSSLGDKKWGCDLYKRFIVPKKLAQSQCISRMVF